MKIVDTVGGRDIYAKKPVDHTLRISKQLRDEFSLGPEGRPVKPKSKSKR